MSMKVAIVHYWLVGMRGGEAVIESLCRLFPEADIYTHVYDPTEISDLICSHRVHTSFINKLPFAKKKHEYYLALMPLALESLDLTGYDLIISSEAGPSKGIISRPDAVHICYAHSPMRYIWDQYHSYRKTGGFMVRMLMPVLTHYLRMWDVSSSARVDCFISNSSFIQKRVRKFYRRESYVVPPPVAGNEFHSVEASEVGEYYLWAGELVSYKRPDLLIAAFVKMQKPLVIIGGGDISHLIPKSGADNIQVLGRVSEEQLKFHMARCRALVFPGVEDFGIVPVEVMASGRPVIALAAGGALDTVIHMETGYLFQEQTVDSLTDAVLNFEMYLLNSLDSDKIIEHALRFSENNFQTGFIKVLSDHNIYVNSVVDAQFELIEDQHSSVDSLSETNTQKTLSDSYAVAN